MNRHTATAVFLVGLCLPCRGWAVDTIESFDVGATDLELYTGYDGFGLNRADRSLSSSLVAGFGIVDRVSATLGATLASDELFTQGSGEVAVGLFGTVVDTDHFDLDLTLDFALGGPEFTEFQVGPGLELNLDFAPDLERFGLFVLVTAPVYGRDAITNDGASGREVATHISTTIGAYLTIAGRHQVLLDYEMALHPMAVVDEAAVELGSVGVGYNVTVHDAIELITELRVDIPQADEAPSIGFVAGFIATLPSSHSTPAVAQTAKDGEG